jgi:hypothetical protein
MFESRERLSEEIGGLLDAIRGLARGRYACLVEPKGIVFESPEPESREQWRLRRLIEGNSAALFTIPESLASGAPMEDLFGGWDEDEFFLAIINGRVALVVACPEAEPLREQALRPLQALTDRLFRYKETYRMDPKGRGFFFGSPKLDMVVIGRAQE